MTSVRLQRDKPSRLYPSRDRQGAESYSESGYFRVTIGF